MPRISTTPVIRSGEDVGRGLGRAKGGLRMPKLAGGMGAGMRARTRASLPTLPKTGLPKLGPKLPRV